MYRFGTHVQRLEAVVGTLSAIRLALTYRPHAVEVVGEAAILSASTRRGTQRGIHAGQRRTVGLWLVSTAGAIPTFLLFDWD